ncbi:CGLD25 [Auxenochlorella protothecoides x Auxenochlorella symbiontica]
MIAVASNGCISSPTHGLSVTRPVASARLAPIARRSIHRAFARFAPHESLVNGMHQGMAGAKLRPQKSRSWSACMATGQQKEGVASPNPPPQTNILATAGLFTIWASLLAYAFFVAPNQTPLRDAVFIQKLVGLGDPTTTPVNAVFTQLFLAMGVWPLIYTALLIPSARSGNGVPAWPFCTLSFAAGVFALLPYMALWTPEREGSSREPRRGPRILESRMLPIATLAGAVYCIAAAALAGSDAWVAFFQLFWESRFVHVTTVDFSMLCLLAPFWVGLDASQRGFQGRAAGLAALPLLGPAIYLCLRPRAPPTADEAERQ